MSIKIMNCFLPLLLIQFFLVNSRTYDCSKIGSIENFKLKMESKVIRMKEELISKYQTLCSNQNILQCKFKSDDLCEGTSKVTCIKNFPTPLGCLIDGTYLGNKSGIRISNSLPKKSLSDNARAFICASAELEDLFQQIHQDNQGQFSYTYIGSSSGVARVYPSFRQDLENNYCVGYDPRIRPWYTSTMTGQKNTIILLDISRTMTSLYPGVRFRNALNTIHIILETLTKYDHVGVVAFSRTAKVVSNLVHANEGNKKQILEKISNLTTELGFTNYQQAIIQGVQLFNSTAECSQIVFLLLTDGYGDNQSYNLTNIKTIITTGLKKYGKSQENLKIISFVYGIEENINYDFIKDLTCTYNGIILRIKDGVDNYTMIQKLSSYYAFLYQGRDENSSIPRWSEPYQDAFGFQEIISVTVLVKHKRYIIGVAAVDILFNRLTQDCQYKRQDILKILKHETQCFKSSLTKAEVEFLRCKQGNAPCQYSQTCSNLNKSRLYLPCISSINNDVFNSQLDDLEVRSNRCCYQIQTKTFVGSLGGAIFIGVVPIIVYAVKKHFVGKEKKQTRIDLQEQVLRNEYILEDREKKYQEASKNGITIYTQNFRLILK